jgi:hypothetical protein
MKNLIQCVIFIGLLVGIPAVSFAQNTRSVINRIKTVGSMVEVEFASDQEFTPRDALIELHLGENVYSRSRAPSDGSLNRIIFVVPADEFASKVNDGDPVWIDYRGQQERGQTWNFGKLNKRQLDNK